MTILGLETRNLGLEFSKGYVHVARVTQFHVFENRKNLAKIPLLSRFFVLENLTWLGRACR